MLSCLIRHSSRRIMAEVASSSKKPKYSGKREFVATVGDEVENDPKKPKMQVSAVSSCFATSINGFSNRFCGFVKIYMCEFDAIMNRCM